MVGEAAAAVASVVKDQDDNGVVDVAADGVVVAVGEDAEGEEEVAGGEGVVM